jgi:LysR family transcriptional regulator, transcriptional activator for dmlA
MSFKSTIHEGSTTSDLVFFTSLCKRGSITALARELDVTPSAVSKRLTQIEKHLGVRLINRTTRHLALTDNGALYLEHARRILGDIDEMERLLRRKAAVPKGLLKVNAPMGFGRTYIAPIISGFGRLHPEVEVQLHLTDRPVSLGNDDFDVAIRFGELPDARVIARKVAPNRRLLCASPDYLNVHGRPSEPQELLSHKCIVLRQNDSGFGTWRLTKDGKTAAIRVSGLLSSNDGEVTLTWALDGHGILMRAEWDLARYFRSGRLEPVLSDYQLPGADIYAVYSDQNQTTPKVVAFVDFVAARFERQKKLEDGDARPW